MASVANEAWRDKLDGVEARPVINVEEHIGRTVGRRSAPTGAGMQVLLNQANRTLKRGDHPRGVFRFRSHEEADLWMIKSQSRRQVS